MDEIGRNDPCLCLSGKKAKNCCINYNQYYIYKNLKKEIEESNEFWRKESVKKLQTGYIINILRTFGINVTIKRFLKRLQTHNSIEEIVNLWQEKYEINISPAEMDFLYPAAWVLWKRLAPNIITTEYIDELMQKGYELLYDGNMHRGFVVWWKTWNLLKDRMPQELTSIKQEREIFLGMQNLHNWCQDFSMELKESGKEETQYLKLNIKFCKEVLKCFPDSPQTFLATFISNCGSSYFYLGLIKKGEQFFKKQLARYPSAASAYLGWGILYLSDEFRDIEKAKRIYYRALKLGELNKYERRDILHNLLPLLPSKIAKQYDQINKNIQKGSNAKENLNYIDANKYWFRAWEQIKSLIDAEIKSIETARNQLLTVEPLDSWLYHFFMVLIMVKTEEMIQKRIDLCNEILQMFPDSDEEFIQNVKKARDE
ncbi:MAG: SEC-C metal-binding domain-containing protein [Promethearchaeia archaeon]